MQAKKQVTDGSKQAEGYKEEVENSVAHVNQLESNACFFFSILILVEVIPLCYSIQI